jgi:CO/xanthine dehydrogenase Mo-binding subunit/CO/xanthine dehydrogenase FAD-binding subunit
METHRTLADWQNGRLHLWSSTATPLPLKQQMSMVLRLPEEQIVVHEVAVGGSFGAKIFITDHETIAAALARVSGRPVLVALTREEEFETTRSRHGFELNLTLHGDHTGRARTLEGSIRVDSGAYIHSGASVMGASMLPYGAMYRLDGVDVDARLVDTSKLPGGAFRGYGGPQTSFALESLMDELAVKLGRDPLQFRIDNAYRSGDTALISKLGTVGIVDCLQRAGEAIGWKAEKANRQPGRGVGVAVGEHVSGAYSFPDANRCDGIINLYSDGRIQVRFGGSDAGTGQKTILAQIAAEELGIALDRVSVQSMDTDETPWDMGAWSSRGTHYTAHGIRKTARDLAEKLRILAAPKVGNDVRLEDGFASGALGRITLGDLVAMSAESRNGVLTQESQFYDTHVQLNNPFGDGTGKVTATHNYTAQAAIVDVDAKTGKVRLIDYVAATDAGTILNPLLLEGQVAGAVVMGIGGALGEELIFEQGKLVNPAFLHYAAPRAADVPRIRALHAPNPDENGPYGAKGVGEVGTVPPTATIANAVFDAIGVRVREMPLTPDKVINGIAEKEGRKRIFNIWRRPSRWWIAIVRWAYPLGLFKLLHERQQRIQNLNPSPSEPIESILVPKTVADAVRALGPTAAVLGGGTDLQLRRRQGIDAPQHLVSVNAIDALRNLDVLASGDIRIGAAVTLAELAEAMHARLPVLHEVIAEIASPQIRNVATVAGNLRQVKRCWFFRNGFNCYKRRGGLAPCYAIQGDHRFYHTAIDGHRCQAVTPSDLATVLVALDATATVQGPNGTRELSVESLYTGPGEMDALGTQDLITAITIPAVAAVSKAAYRKLNLWQGDFAIASAALVVQTDDLGRCTKARLCLGAVAPVPWRARQTEQRLLGQKLTAEKLRELLDEELNAQGHPLKRNEWKLDAVAGLAERSAEGILRKSA